MEKDQSQDWVVVGNARDPPRRTALRRDLNQPKSTSWWWSSKGGHYCQLSTPQLIQMNRALLCYAQTFLLLTKGLSFVRSRHPQFPSVPVRSHDNRGKDFITECTIDAGHAQRSVRTNLYKYKKMITKSMVLVATGSLCPKSFLNPSTRSRGQLLSNILG